MKKHAVLIGINRYRHLGALRYAKQDAEATADALKRCYGFSDDEITLMTDESKNIPDDRFAIKNALSPDYYGNDLELFVFGFFGHGIWEDDQRYLCPMNAWENELAESALSLKVVQDLLGNIRAKNICLILDCCQNEVSTKGRSAAQTMTEGEEKSLDLLARDIIGKMKKNTEDPGFDPTVVVLNSCKKGERAFESVERQHGLFTAVLLDAMEKRCKSTAELCDFVRDNVPKSLRTSGVHQTPYYTCAGGSNILLPAVQKEPERHVPSQPSPIPPTAPSVAPTALTVPVDVPTLAEAYEKIAIGGTITVLRGKYDVPKTITIAKNVTIVGDVNNPEYVVLQGGQENVFHIQSGFAELAGLTIQNEGKERPEDIPEDEKPAFGTRYSALVVSAPLGALHDCVFISRHCCGFFVNTKDSNLDVKNCTARNCGLQGFWIGSGALGTFRNCTARNCGRQGFWIGTGASGTFRKCTASGNTNAGMEVRDANTNPTVEDCRFNDGKDVGILVCDCASGTFRNCTASGNAKAGMGVRDANTNPTVEDCRFTDGKSAGIVVCDCASGTFRKCTASGNADVGMAVGDANTNPTVEDCQFTDGKQGGIIVLAGASGTFRKCTASGNAYAGMQVGDANTNPTVEDSKFNDGKECGIFVLNGASGTFRNCTASGNAKAGIQVRDANTNPTVEDCTFEKNQGRGVWVYKGASGKFRRNKLSGNSWWHGNWNVSGAASDLVREGNTPNK